MRNADMPAMAVVGSDCHGLTKREHFAAMAMQELASDMERVYDACPEGEVPGVFLAMNAVKMADALLAELEKTK